MTQSKLGAMLGISAETLKSIEGSRRRQGALSKQVKDAAWIYLGAKWNPKRSRWEASRFDHEAGVEKIAPYTRVHYEQRKNAAFDPEAEIAALQAKLRALLESVPDRHFPILSDTVNIALDDFRDRFNVRIKNRHDFTCDFGLTNLLNDADEVVGYRRESHVLKFIFQDDPSSKA